MLSLKFRLVVELHANKVGPVDVVVIGHARVADIAGMSEGLDQKLSIVWFFMVQVDLGNIPDVVIMLRLNKISKYHVCCENASSYNSPGSSLVLFAQI